MENEQRIFLAYRAIFEGNNAQIRQPKAIMKVVVHHRASTQTLLKSLGEKHIVDTLKSLLDRKVFQSELEPKMAFPDLFTTSLAQDVQHNASEADAAKSEAEALEDVAFLEDDKDDAIETVTDEVPPVLSCRSAYLITGHGLTTHTANAARPGSNGIQIPSLYPLYVPYKVQHVVLTRTQSLLEECCYDFTAQWLPELLEQRRGDCPESIELNKWTYIVVKRLNKLPYHRSQAFRQRQCDIVSQHTHIHQQAAALRCVSSSYHSEGHLGDDPCRDRLC